MEKPITTTSIVDIFNLIGVCVVSGNIRRCLPEDSYVHTKDGLISIKDVEIGQKVLTMYGYNKITDKVMQGKRDLVTIVTEQGTFRCTPNHRMAVLNNNTDTNIDNNIYIWKTAEDLTLSDKLITSRVAIEGKKTKLPDTKAFSVPNLNTDIAWFIGILHSYGHYNQDGTLQFCSTLQIII